VLSHLLHGAKSEGVEIVKAAHPCLALGSSQLLIVHLLLRGLTIQLGACAIPAADPCVIGLPTGSIGDLHIGHMVLATPRPYKVPVQKTPACGRSMPEMFFDQGINKSREP